MIFFFFFYNSSIRQKDKEGNKKGILYTETQDLKKCFLLREFKVLHHTDKLVSLPSYDIYFLNFYVSLFYIFDMDIEHCLMWTCFYIGKNVIFKSSFHQFYCCTFCQTLFFSFYPQPFFKTTKLAATKATANLKHLC